MNEVTLTDLQESVQDRSAFGMLDDYPTICRAFLVFVQKARPTRIVSPSHRNYIFYQYGEDYGHKITRPLNVDAFVKNRHSGENRSPGGLQLLEKTGFRLSPE